MCSNFLSLGDFIFTEYVILITVTQSASVCEGYIVILSYSLQVKHCFRPIFLMNSKSSYMYKISSILQQYYSLNNLHHLLLHLFPQQFHSQSLLPFWKLTKWYYKEISVLVLGWYISIPQNLLTPEFALTPYWYWCITVLLIQ